MNYPWKAVEHTTVTEATLRTFLIKISFHWTCFRRRNNLVIRNLSTSRRITRRQACAPAHLLFCIFIDVWWLLRNAYLRLQSRFPLKVELEMRCWRSTRLISGPCVCLINWAIFCMIGYPFAKFSEIGSTRYANVVNSNHSNALASIGTLRVKLLQFTSTSWDCERDQCCAMKFADSVQYLFTFWSALGQPSL